MDYESSTAPRSSFSIYQAGNAIDGLWTIGLLLAALLLYGMHLGDLPLRDWDEGIVAQVARDLAFSLEALKLDNWLYPTQSGEPYLNKPPLMHWLIALSYSVGGINEWTTRLPGAILTACSVPLLYLTGREVFPRRTPAVFAAFMYLTLLPVVRHGRLAMLDGAVVCFSLVMMGCLLRARRDIRWAIGVGIGLGLVCFTKGFLGLLLGGIALAFLLWDTPRLLRSPYLWLGIGLGIAPVLGWYGLQWQHYQAQFLQHTLLNQSLNRIWSGVEANTGPPWYYLWEIGKTAWPWLIFWPAGCWYAWQNRTLSWGKFCLVWSSLYLLAISLMATKLPWYVLPMYPPLALIGGMQLSRLWDTADFTGMPQLLKQAPHRSWLIGLGSLAVLAWACSLYFYWIPSPETTDLSWILLALALTLSATTILLAYRNAQFVIVLIWGTYLTLLLLMQSPHWLWELNEAYPIKPVVTLIRKYVPPDRAVYTTLDNTRPSLAFYSERSIKPVETAELQRLWQTLPPPYVLLPLDRLPEFQLQSIQPLGCTPLGWCVITRTVSRSVKAPVVTK